MQHLPACPSGHSNTPKRKTCRTTATSPRRPPFKISRLPFLSRTGCLLQLFQQSILPAGRKHRHQVTAIQSGQRAEILLPPGFPVVRRQPGQSFRINEQTTRNPGNIGRRDGPHLFQTVGPQQSFEPGHIGFMRRARRGERQQARHEAAMAEETVEPGEKERIAHTREKKIGRKA